MRSADPTGPPTPAAWPEADLVRLTIRLANAPGSELPTGLATGRTNEPAPPELGPLTGRVADRRGGVLGPSTAPVEWREGLVRPSTALAEHGWSVPLLVTPEVEAWLFGWPAGVVTPAHGHRGAAEALTVVEGSLSEECLDPTIWTTGRRTTWPAGASTLFPSGHVHLLGAAGDRPAVTVHAWSRPAGSADRVAGGRALSRPGAAAGRGPGRGRDAAEPVGVGAGRCGRGCLVGQPVHGAADLVHVRDRVAG
jgi:quercetin dioxygenase-like cupin family protein